MRYMPVVTRSTLSAFSVIVVLSVTACGGGDESSTGAGGPSSGPTVDPDEFVQELNAICKDANTRVGRLNQDADDAGDPQAIADAFDAAAAVYEVSVSKLEALEAPAGDQGTYAGFKRSITRNQGIIRRMATAARAGDTDTISVLSDAADAETTRRLKAALDLGADQCGQTNVGGAS